MATKKIINADIGKGWHYFESSVLTATKGDSDEIVTPGDIGE